MAIDQSSFFNNEFFAYHLKSNRQRLDLTLDQFSILTKEIDPKGEGISKMTLSRYETGATLPGLRELKIISFALRKPVAALIYEEIDDPMTSYKLTLELRITETVNQMLTADGLIKDEDAHEPKTPEYFALVEKIKNQK